MTRQIILRIDLLVGIRPACVELAGSGAACGVGEAVVGISPSNKITMNVVRYMDTNKLNLIKIQQHLALHTLLGQKPQNSVTPISTNF